MKKSTFFGSFFSLLLLPQIAQADITSNGGIYYPPKSGFSGESKADIRLIEAQRLLLPCRSYDTIKITVEADAGTPGIEGDIRWVGGPAGDTVRFWLYKKPGTWPEPYSFNNGDRRYRQSQSVERSFRVAKSFQLSKLILLNYDVFQEVKVTTVDNIPTCKLPKSE